MARSENKPRIKLSTGRVVHHYPMESGATSAELEEGGEMTEDEWQEYALRTRLQSLRVGERAEIPPNAYVKKHKSNDYSLNDRTNKHRNRWGTIDEIVADVQHYQEHGNLPPPSGGRW